MSQGQKLKGTRNKYSLPKQNIKFKIPQDVQTVMKQTSDNSSIELNDLPFIFTFKVPQVVLGDTKRQKIPQQPHCPPLNLNLNIRLASKKCACESMQQSQGYLYFIIKANSTHLKRRNECHV